MFVVYVYWLLLCLLIVVFELLSLGVLFDWLVVVYWFEVVV